MADKIDMSLDDIIKMNRKNRPAGAASTVSGKGGIGKKFQSQKQNQRQTNTGFRGGNNGRVQRVRANANMLRGKRLAGGRFTAAALRTSGRGAVGIKSAGQRSVNRARQTLRTALLRKQVTANSKSSKPQAGSAGRRKLVRPGFGVLQSDILAQQLEQRKRQIAFKQAIDQSKAAQQQRQQRQRQQQQQQRQQSAVRGAPSSAGSNPWAVAGRQVAPSGRGGGSTLRVQLPNSVSSQRVATNPAAANRILKHSINQSMRGQRGVNRGQRGVNRRANVRRRVGSNFGTVRMLSNTILDLKQQVADLQNSTRATARQTGPGGMYSDRTNRGQGRSARGNRMASRVQARQGGVRGRLRVQNRGQRKWTRGGNSTSNRNVVW